MVWNLVTLSKQTAPYVTAYGTCILLTGVHSRAKCSYFGSYTFYTLPFFLFKIKIKALCSRYSAFTCDLDNWQILYPFPVPAGSVFYFGASTRALASNEPNVKSVQGLKLLCSSRLFVAQLIFTLNLKLGHKWLKFHHPKLRLHIFFHVVVEVGN